MALKNAHDELRDWISRSGRDTAYVASALQITTPHVTHLVKGSRTPSLRLAVRIAALTGIPVSDWVKRDEVEGVPI
jgi:plasmid maintenance system antidote protein VapI